MGVLLVSSAAQPAKSSGYKFLLGVKWEEAPTDAGRNEKARPITCHDERALQRRMKKGNGYTPSFRLRYPHCSRGQDEYDGLKIELYQRQSSSSRNAPLRVVNSQ